MSSPEDPGDIITLQTRSGLTLELDIVNNIGRIVEENTPHASCCSLKNYTFVFITVNALSWSVTKWIFVFRFSRELGCIIPEAQAAAPCLYATATDRTWLGCQNCTAVECRHPQGPNIKEVGGVRLPVQEGNVLQNANFLEVRSRYCNSKTCSNYTT